MATISTRQASGEIALSLRISCGPSMGRSTAAAIPRGGAGLKSRRTSRAGVSLVVLQRLRKRRKEEKGKGWVSEVPCAQIVPVHRTFEPSWRVIWLPAFGYVVFEMVISALTSRFMALETTGRY